jgi:N-acetylglucosamine-6-phosphate deacetylase
LPAAHYIPIFFYFELTVSPVYHIMPSAVPVNGMPVQIHEASGVTKFTNCLLVKDNALVSDDLWVSSASGKILNGQELLFEHRTAPDHIIDLGGRILSPGFIETQINGAYGFDFSVIPDEGSSSYSKGVSLVNRSLVATGVTSYLPTLTSQQPGVYQQVTSDQTYCISSAHHCTGPPFFGALRCRSRSILWL